MDVTIIIVVYNGGEWFFRTLRFLKKEGILYTVPTIVIDNGSINDTTIRASYEFPEVQFIFNNKNLGFGAANNVGLKKCDTRFIMFLNPDTELSMEALISLRDFLQKDESIWLVGPKLISIDGTVQKQCRIRTRFFPLFFYLIGLHKIKSITGITTLAYTHDDYYKKINYPQSLPGACMLARTDRIKEINGFDERYFMYVEDADLCHRIWDAGGRVAYYPYSTVVHAEGGGKAYSFRAHLYSVKSLYIYFMKDGRKFEGIIIACVYFLTAFLRMLRKNILKKC